MSIAVAASCLKSVASPSEMPQVARINTSAATTSAVSSGPCTMSCSTRGTCVRSRAMRIALEANATPRRMPNARAARTTGVFLRDTAQGRAMRCVDGVELGAERREGSVAELGDETARQVAGKARAVLRAREGRPVDVCLAVADALEEAFLVEPDHDRQYRCVGTHSRPGELLVEFGGSRQDRCQVCVQ